MLSLSKYGVRHSRIFPHSKLWATRLSTREVLKIIQELPAPPVGVDLVEFNPTRDPQGITAMTAAKLLRELIGRMLA
jgi:arginase family enzyme